MATSGLWLQCEIDRHACDVFEPAGQRRGAILFLHGAKLERLAGQTAFEAELDRHGLCLMAPRGGQSWWTDRIWPRFDAELSAERYLVEHVAPEILRRWPAANAAIALLGVGMGGQGALRLAFKHPRMFSVVAALSPAIDYQHRWYEEETLQAIYADPEAARQDTATLHVHPLNWPRNIFFACDPTNACWFDSADKLRMKLAALGIPHERDLETSVAGGHLAYYQQQASKAIAFIAERLAAESRRV